MPVTLYHAPGACSLAAHILLRETAADFSLERVDLRNGDQHSDRFLQLNPKGRVPVLVDGKEVLTELPAIAAYIAKRFGNGNLWPDEPWPLARLLEWFNWLSGTVHAQGFGMLWRPARFAGSDAAKAEIRAQAPQVLAENFRDIETRLRGRWALGEQYSAADPFLFVLHLWGRKVGLASENEHPNWSRHHDAMRERDAVIAALQAEGLAG